MEGKQKIPFNRMPLVTKLEAICACLVVAGALTFGALKGVDYLNKKFHPEPINYYQTQTIPYSK